MSSWNHLIAAIGKGPIGRDFSTGQQYPPAPKGVVVPEPPKPTNQMKVTVETLTPEEALNALAAAKDELAAASVELCQVETRKGEAEHAVLRATNQLVNLAIDRQTHQSPPWEERYRSSANRKN